MNVNDVICVGAEPIAVLDYIAVEEADPAALEQIALGLRAGAEAAGVEIPGGELAVLPELIQGHPSPLGFDLLGFCIGLVELDPWSPAPCHRAPATRSSACPSSGVHSNGLTLAREVLSDRARGAASGGARTTSPCSSRTAIYVRATASPARLGRRRARARPHHGRGPAQPAAARGRDGLHDRPAAAGAGGIEDIAERGGAGRTAQDIAEVFDVPFGFCCVVPAGDADGAVESSAAATRARR